jgi:probable rRNA maturation factor
VIEIEVDNRSGVVVDEAAATALACDVLVAEGVDAGELGLAFVGPDEIRALKAEHLGIDEATDVLSFPIDGREDVPDGVPRALGEAWREPLIHGLLHLLGHDHGDAMEARERVHAGQ